jgi:aspartyl-tRNA(Asn)/glutamyl-tRNA(Gln) amidotransferase subunit C
MSLNRQEVEKIAHLARLQLAPEEIEPLTRQLNSIVTYVCQLQQVETDEIEPFTHAVALENVFRADEPVSSLPVEAALANASARQENFFRVPPVLD